MSIIYRQYEPPERQDTAQNVEERDLTEIRKLIAQDLSEPYGIYVYRYFIYQWPNLCFLALEEENVIGVIVCKLDPHRGVKLRGYIAMLAVATRHRGKGIARKLVSLAISNMAEYKADEVVLETEVDNEAAIKLYEGMGFLRSKRMHRYYMNASDAFRLILPISQESTLRYCVLANSGSEQTNDEQIYG
ncbi:acyl-CoA N-acyltransferase [Kockiozyma suomiensis]|uniref:acyl-CoA N-acyltransferase n=1 Tax=Kockiozyma suomiensis TaxID=1337062 RepID=UPI003343C8B9